MEVVDAPIKDCEDCLHASVCKFISMFNKWKQENTIPLDFDTASCLAYMPISAYGDMIGDSEEEHTGHPFQPPCKPGRPEPANDSSTMSGVDADSLLASIGVAISQTISSGATVSHIVASKDVADMLYAFGVTHPMAPHPNGYKYYLMGANNVKYFVSVDLALGSGIMMVVPKDA